MIRSPIAGQYRSYIYVISDGEFLKIGKANNPKRRLAQIQTHSPRALRLVHTRCVHVGRAIAAEQSAHKALAEFRRNGEWFACAEDVATAAVEAAVRRINNKTPRVATPRLWRTLDNLQR